MLSPTSLTSASSAKSWILLGIPVLFIVGSLMHFIYEWSGNGIIVGVFSPVNESVWEHLKLTFWPMLLWWSLGYFILNKSNPISPAKWFFSCVTAELICPLVIVSFYYTYTGAFGIESLILDIFSLLLGLTLGQVLALHVYKHAKLGPGYFNIAIAILALMAMTYTMFTFSPPHLPLFKDGPTGKYGI